VRRQRPARPSRHPQDDARPLLAAGLPADHQRRHAHAVEHADLRHDAGPRAAARGDRAAVEGGGDDVSGRVRRAPARGGPGRSSRRRTGCRSCGARCRSSCRGSTS
jgi:hypothetical protein